MDDLISRQAALDALKTTHWFTVQAESNTDFPCGTISDIASINVHMDVDAVKRAIENVPAVTGWISVKDRLPDAAGYECLVCAVNEIYNQVHVFTAHTGYGEPGWWTGNVHYMARVKSPSDNRVHHALRITHWMPLPEPPKEE